MPGKIILVENYGSLEGMQGTALLRTVIDVADDEHNRLSRLQPGELLTDIHAELKKRWNVPDPEFEHIFSQVYRISIGTEASSHPGKDTDDAKDAARFLVSGVCRQGFSRPNYWRPYDPALDDEVCTVAAYKAGDEGKHGVFAVSVEAIGLHAVWAPGGDCWDTIYLTRNDRVVRRIGTDFRVIDPPREAAIGPRAAPAAPRGP